MKPAHIYVAVVDDDIHLCNSLSRLLRAAKFVPISFQSAEEYLSDPVREHFSCLLTDVQLSGMSGLELQQRLLLEKTPCPVLFITSCDDPSKREAALQAGCIGFFQKTDDGSKILDCVRQAILSANRLV